MRLARLLGSLRSLHQSRSSHPVSAVGVGTATATGLDDEAGLGVGVAIATEGIGVTSTTGVGVAVMLATGMWCHDGSVPQSTETNRTENRQRDGRGSTKDSPDHYLRFGGGAGCVCGRTDGGVAGSDTGTLVGRLAAAMFSFSAFENS